MNTKFQAGEKVVAIKDLGDIFRKGDVGEVVRHDDDGTVRVSWPSHQWWTEETAVVKFNNGLAPAGLTLPIVVGKKYVRRDGVIVEAKVGHPSIVKGEVFVGQPGDQPDASSNHVDRKTGRVWINHHLEHDLVSDYIEPAKGHPHAALMAQFAEDASKSETPWDQWEMLDTYGEWFDMTRPPEWHITSHYRRRPKPTPDPHAENAAEYAKDMALSDKAWEGWETDFGSQDNWYPLTEHPNWRAKSKFRRKEQS